MLILAGLYRQIFIHCSKPVAKDEETREIGENMQVTKITKTICDKPRVCAYARVSTNHDAQEDSLEVQIAYWDKKFKDNPDVEFVGLFTDDGISGKEMRKRKGLMAVLQLVREGKVDKVYTKSISRFARNYIEITEIIREFREIGVPIIFEKENINTLDPASSMILSVMSSLAEEELKSISKNQTWAIRKRFAKGNIELVRITGYNYKGKQLTVNEEEKKVIRRIFDLYLSGCGMVKICNILDAEGYKPMYADHWVKSSVRRILLNEKYTGNCLLQKTVGDLHRRWRNTGEAPQYYVEGTHEAIVTMEEWEEVQRQFRERAEHFRPGAGSRNVYPLSGKILCGQCGTKYVRKTCAKGTTYECIKWKCRKKDQEGIGVCQSTDIKNDVLEKLLVEAYNECLDARLVHMGVAEEENKLNALLATEKELRELHIKGYLPDRKYREETEKLLLQIMEEEQIIQQLKARNTDTTKYKKSDVFTKDMADFLIAVVVDEWKITFEFGNGYKVTKTYTNGRAGNVNGKLRKQKT